MATQLKTEKAKSDVATLVVAIQRAQMGQIRHCADKTHQGLAVVIRDALSIGLLDDSQYSALRKYARAQKQDFAYIVQTAISEYLKRANYESPLP